MTMTAAPVDRNTSTLKAPVGSGVFVVVVGPSGAGKDSVINALRQHFVNNSYVLFVRRVITRTADGNNEDHETATVDEFERARQAGRFAVSWQAHGLHYGIPIAVDDHVAAGNVAVCNGSRGALTEIDAHYENLIVLNITAPPEELARRLAARGRESQSDILKRLRRKVESTDDRVMLNAIEVDNSSDLQNAVDQCIGEIERGLASASGDGRQ